MDPERSLVVFGRHLFHRPGLDRAGVVDQHLDRAEIGFDLLEARRTGFERRHVPLVDADAGLGLELLRRLVVARVIRRDLVSGSFQGLRDCCADTAGTTSHHCNASHTLLLSFLAIPRQAHLRA
jgi:hypothetical protein